MPEKPNLQKNTEGPHTCPPQVCNFRVERAPAKRSFFELDAVRRTGATLAFLALGAGIGYAAEGHTNDVARGKAETASVCLEVVPHGSTIGKDLEACFTKGVPGGSPIGSNKLTVGEPIQFVSSYIHIQNQEAAHIESSRIVGWAVGGDVLHVIGGVLTACSASGS